MSQISIISFIFLYALQYICRKYPFIFTVGCNPGEFNNVTECFCESWLWAADENGPAGAIGHLGSTISQSWEHPMHGQYAMNVILNDDDQLKPGEDISNSVTEEGKNNNILDNVNNYSPIITLTLFQSLKRCL